MKIKNTKLCQTKVNKVKKIMNKIKLMFSKELFKKIITSHQKS